MTAPNGLRRRRRTNERPGIPPGVAAWFEGTGPVPWEALLPGHFESVPGWWREWRREHRGAQPPAGAPWIEWPRR